MECKDLKRSVEFYRETDSLAGNMKFYNVMGRFTEEYEFLQWDWKNYRGI